MNELAPANDPLTKIVKFFEVAVHVDVFKTLSEQIAVGSIVNVLGNKI